MNFADVGPFAEKNTSDSKSHLSWVSKTNQTSGVTKLKINAPTEQDIRQDVIMAIQDVKSLFALPYREPRR